MTAYDDLDSPQAMRDDAARVANEVQLGPTSAIRFDGFPRDLPKPEIRVSEAAQRLADALGLYLD